MRRFVSVMLAFVVVLVYGASSSAAAGPVGGNGGTKDGAGYSVTVSFSGDAAPGGGGTIGVGVPATCWWEPAQLSRLDGSYADPTNADELETWYKVDLPALINASFVIFREGYGDWTSWQPSLDEIRAGEKITAYQPHCREGAPVCALNGFSGSAFRPIPAITGECGIPVAIGFFVTGNPPPAQVAPADLAQVAHDQMQIPEPLVDRNPKVIALAGATLVGLPTWFWVTDPASIGGAAGTRTIRAEVGPVWAEVVARTDGLHLTSPAGGASCGPDAALTAYARGVDEGAACTVSFSGASVGYPAGYPVDASTVWTAAWTGSGNTGGDLASLLRGTSVDVPVAESQTVVTDAR